MSEKDQVKKLKKTYLNWFILTLLVIAALIWHQVYYLQAAQDQTKVVFCDVGQGDAILIDFGKNEQALIDGGPDKSVLACLGQNMPLADKKIEHLILTHPDKDHLAGLISTIENYEIGKLYHPGVEHTSGVYKEFQGLVKEREILETVVRAGQVISTDRASLKFLWPQSGWLDEGNLNNNSLVCLFDQEEVEVLLTGDGEEEVWQELKRQLVKVEVLKVAHHGASNGTSEELLEKTRPEVGIISVGARNGYGHPTGDTLNLLEKYGAKIYRTDEDGEIEVVVGEDGYEVKK